MKRKLFYLTASGSDKHLISRMRKFTLIELLTVISIIGLLASMLMPVIANTKEIARGTSCANNLRQLAFANNTYHSDYECFSPAASQNNFIGFNYSKIEGSAQRWYGTLQDDGAYDRRTSPLYEYVKGKTELIDCPGFRSTTKNEKSGGIGYSLFIGTRNRPGDGSEMNWQSGCPVKRIKKASEILMFSDAAIIDGGSPVSMWYVSPPTYKNKLNTVPSMHFRHRGKANISWVDGHVDSQAFFVSCDDNHKEQLIGWFQIDGLPNCESGTDAYKNRHWKPALTNN